LLGIEDKMNKEKITAKQAWLRFKEYSSKNGYTNKIVGDYGFRNTMGKIIRLKGVSGSRLLIYEETIGTYKINLEGDIKNEKGFV